MALKTFKPYTPSRRFLTMLDKSDITKQTPEKSLVESKKRTGGRNSHGEVTSWHRGGGHARKYRSIDFRREKLGIPAKVAAIEYDPNRSARIALLHYADGEKRYILAAGWSRSWDDDSERRGRRHSSGKRADDPAHPARHDGS